jgi:hypothetical protein
MLSAPTGLRAGPAPLTLVSLGRWQASLQPQVTPSSKVENTRM